MKKFLLILLFSNSIFLSYGQNYPRMIDSLRKILAGNLDDSARFDALSLISVYYQESNLDSNMKYADEAYRLSLKSKSSQVISMGLRSMAGSLWRRGNQVTALEFYFRAQKIYEELNDSTKISMVYLSIGHTYNSQNDEARAIEYFLKSLASSPPIGTSALSDVSRMRALLNVGEAYLKIGKLDSALYYGQQSYEMGLKISIQRYLPVTLKLLGNIQQKSGNTDLALEYYRLGLKDAIGYNNLTALSDNYLAIAQLFYENKLMDSAYIYASNAFAVARQVNNIYSIQASSTLLNQIFKNRNKLDSAYKYHEIMFFIKDSLLNLEKIQQVQNLSFNEELRLQEIANAKILAQEERKKNLQFVAIAAFIVCFITGFILLSRKRSAVKLVRFLGIVGLLLLFEFIALLTHPWIEELTHHSPVWSLLLLVLLASVLVPAHHYFEKLIKEKLVHREINTPVANINEEEQKDIAAMP